jgi:sec-independent protein translocase protein TatB
VLDINATEGIVLLLLALMLIGPSRLPKYAQDFGRLVRRMRDFARETQTKVETELGVHHGDIAWDALDPRHYDPRRIVRDALTETPHPGLNLRPPAPPARPNPAPAPAPGPAPSTKTEADPGPGA